ncbi:MAG: hypothetical protein P1U74_11395 [Legionellaceae bacterium]|nr:hypothetical protein [Legionellaceae bacterium]
MTSEKLDPLIKDSLTNNKKSIIDAMDLAIDATSKSFNPYKKKEKVAELTRIRSLYENNGKEEDLINFLLISQKTRGFTFGRKAGSFQSLEKSFSTLLFLKDLLNIILASTNSDFNAIVLKWNKKKYEPLDRLSSSESVMQAIQSPQGIEENRETQEIVDLDLQGHTETEALSSKSSNSTPRTSRTSSRASSPKIENPLRLVPSEKITSLADMAGKIKLIQQDEVKKIMTERFRGKAPKKKVEPKEIQPSPEQLTEIKSLLVESGILDDSEDGVLTPVTFTEEDKEIKNSALDKAANIMRLNNLQGLAYDKEFKIAKYEYKKIQSKSHEQALVLEAYEKSKPIDDEFIERCMTHMTLSGLNLSSLTYSSTSPFTKDQFDELIELGQTDAEKINRLCGDILYVDTRTLFDKINRGYFMSRGLSKDKIKEFTTELKRGLSKIGWSFERMIEEREKLEESGLKLDLQIILDAQSVASEKNSDETTHQDTKNERPPNPLLGAITSKPKLKSTTNPEAEVRPPNPLLGAITSKPKLKSTTNPEAEVRPPNPLLGAITSKPKLKSTTNPEAEVRPPNPLLGDITSKPKLKSTTNPEAGARPPNPLLGAITSKPKLKSTKPKNETTKDPTTQTTAEKRDIVKNILGGGGKRTPPPSPPADLSGRNKITVYSEDPKFISFVENYLKDHFNLKKSKCDNGYEFIISSSKTKFGSSEEVKESIRRFARHVKSGDYSPFESIFKIERYSPIFAQELNLRFDSNQMPIKSKIPTFEVTYNQCYDNRRSEFEGLLSESNIVFLKRENKYIFNTEDWDSALIQKLKSNKFFSDYFSVTSEEKLREISESMERNTPVVKFDLNIPTPELRSRFEKIFNEKFRNDSEYYIDSARFMVISSDKKDEFIQCLESLTGSHNFGGEYINADLPDFSSIIEEKISHRLMITVSKDKDNLKLQRLFENDLNTRIENSQSVTYYVDQSTLTNHKEEFFNLAAEANLSIEYYDSAKNIYQSIELANDSKFTTSTVPETSPTEVGFFKNGLKKSADESDPENKKNYAPPNTPQ